MTRAPDEIKKDLNDALLDHVHFHKGDPEPHLTHLNYHALERLHADALAYIQQLEAERDAALDDKRGECTHCAFLPGETIPDTCFDCANKGYYRWEWRGVQKEGGL